MGRRGVKSTSFNWGLRKKTPPSLKPTPFDSQAQFLARLLALLAGRPCYRLVLGLPVGLTVGLAIDGAELMSGEVVVDFSR